MSSSYLVPPIASESKNDENAQGSSLTHNENLDFVVRQGSLYQASSYDPSRDVPIPSGSTLEDFLSRPIRIAQFQWRVNEGCAFALDPWALFFTNSKVENRLTNFKLMRCKMNIRVLINGNSFFYGRIIVCYEPLFDCDNMTYFSETSRKDFMGLSQLPHCYISPSTSAGCDMELPFVWYKDVFDVPAREWEGMGKLYLKSIGLLRTANGSTTPVNISLFAWLSDVHVGGLTNVNISQLDPQADEYDVSPVSRIATTVANAAGAWSKIPYIGPYAKATQLGASAISAIAALFGFSKPINLNTNIINRHAKTNFAQFNGMDDAHKLSLDIKQEVSIDPRIVGAPPIDEMSILHIAKKRAYVTRFQWNVTHKSDDLLFSMLVDPCITNQITEDSQEKGFLMLPSAFVTFPFKYWRGSINYHFDIICSSFHKGRLRIGHEPSYVLKNLPNSYNTTNGMIVDIADGDKFEFCVPWSQSTTFRRHAPFGTPDYNLFMPGEVTPLVNVGNGVLFVTVLNPLTNSTNLTGETIEIVVSMSVCDDFEVACPTSWCLTNMRFRYPYNEGMWGSFEPQADNVLKNTVEENPTGDHADDIYFGESVRSIRQLLKRYCYYFAYPMAQRNESNTTLTRLIHPYFPIDGGYNKFPSPSSNPIVTTPITGGVKYMYFNNTYVHYFTKAFVGWRGSLRYMLDCSTVPTGTTNITSRITPSTNHSLEYFAPGDLSSAPKIAYYHNCEVINRAAGGMNGSSISTTTVDCITTVELPYYSPYRFIPARFLYYAGTEPKVLAGSWQNVAKTTGTFKPSDSTHVWVSGGEDFSLYFFLGLPPAYFEHAAFLG